MAWNIEEVRRYLENDHDRIYADLDQMKSKMGRDQHRFQYQEFVGMQSGALYAVTLLKDSDAFTSPLILLHRLDEMELNFDEYLEGFTKEEGVSMNAIRAGYMKKLNEIRKTVRLDKT